tara:strand:+ start:345 stop:548 length:204 start_codon:yes stop_codon:yes gene_type:complete
MKQLERTTLQFYSHAVDTYNDDELNRYLFDLQTAFDAVEKRITELHNENERGIVNMDGTVEKFNGEY